MFKIVEALGNRNPQTANVRQGLHAKFSRYALSRNSKNSL